MISATRLDQMGDAMAFQLVDAALEKGRPTLFICHGFQELNAALGGTLHPRLHEVEGYAPDGMPEPVTVKGAKRFALGVQWHPEYEPLENEFSTRLFRAFSEAVQGKN